MKLRELLEDLETLSVYTVEVLDSYEQKIGETKVIAASESEAEHLAVQKLRKEGADAVSGIVIDTADVESYELSNAA